MKKLAAMAAICLAATAVMGQDAPHLGDETKVMTLDKAAKVRENNGLWSMKLSPDLKHLLYIRGEQAQVPDGDGELRQRTVYRMILRNVPTGAEKVLPAAAVDIDDYIVACLSMKVFGPKGRKIVLPLPEKADGNGIVSVKGGGSGMRVGLYDIASGKVDRLDVKGSVVFPSYDGSGKKLILLSMDIRAMSGTLYVTPADKIDLKPLNQWGLPRSPCPTADLMPLLLPPKRDGPGDMGVLLYDLKADAAKYKLFLNERGTKMDDYNPQWTADGRYLYYVDMKEEGDDESRTRKMFTRVWNVKENKEAGIVDGAVAIGPGPRKTSMVLTAIRSGGPEQRQVLLHDAARSVTWPLADGRIRPISTQAGRLVYVRMGDDGTETVCVAEIVAPKAAGK
jgi:hypothetical protein